MINTIDLFAGCGGLMDGFEQSGKFRTLACVEWEPAPCQNLAKRLRDKWGYTNADEMTMFTANLKAWTVWLIKVARWI